MSKKNLNADGLLNELKGGSSFFPSKPEEPAAEPSQIPPPPVRETHMPTKTTAREESNQASLQASNHASMQALSTEALESIRKIVKNPGKEDVLYVRLTKGEKDKLADVIYTYKRQGVRTSDTEVVRVAINTLLEDYKSNGEKSLLAIILASLHA